jgi:two-component sensor histidine kinase
VLERTNEIEQQKQEIASQRDNLNELNLEISRKNEELERKVDERTKELQAAVEELNANFEELIKSNEEVTRSLHEKEVLLAEVHHRVKNNLAVVSGLLQMQIFSTDHSEVHAILQDSQNRIKSMALIHEKLYQNSTFANVDFADYVRELVSEIGHSYPNQAQSVQVQLDLEPIRLELTVAIPCGLLLNELLSNAYKHAFKGRETGRIDIGLRRQNEHFLLEVKDDGQGMDPSLDIRKTTSMGMKLIQTMVKQLHGQMEFRNEKGLWFRLEFQPVKMKTWNERR